MATVPSTNSRLPCVKGAKSYSSSPALLTNDYIAPLSDRSTTCPLALILGSLAKGELLLLSQAQPTIEGSLAPNLSVYTNTSANNPSVTVTKSSVLYQHIFNLKLKAIPKMLHRTVTAPFTQGSQV